MVRARATRRFWPPESWSTCLFRWSLQAQEVDEFLHLFLGGDAGLVLQPIGDVLVDVQVGEQGVVLKDDVKAALFHHRPGEVLSVIHNGAGVGLYDAQDDVQQGGLAAAGRA